MSKMGQTIIAVQDRVDAMDALGASAQDIMSVISSEFGDMFTGIAEEYYADMNGPFAQDYREVYDVEGYENLLTELEEEGVL